MLARIAAMNPLSAPEAVVKGGAPGENDGNSRPPGAPFRNHV